MNNRLFAFVILLALILLVFGPVAAAQETPPPTQGGEQEPVEEPVEEPIQEPDVPFMERIITFVTGALVGGAGVLITVFGTIGRFKNDTATLNMIEWLGKSIPPEALDKLNEIGRNMRDAGTVLEVVTDGQPNTVMARSSPPMPTDEVGS